MYLPKNLKVFTTTLPKQVAALNSRCYKLFPAICFKNFDKKGIELNNSSLKNYVLHKSGCETCPPPRGETACFDEIESMKVERCYMLIDVREEKEVAKGKIPHAIHIPLTQLVKVFKESSEADFKKKYKIEKPTKKADIIFYSNNQNRSETAMSEAWQMGYDKARYYQGGWNNWLESLKRKKERERCARERKAKEKNKKRTC